MSSLTWNLYFHKFHDEQFGPLSNTTECKPTIISLSAGVDPASSILRNNHTALISFTSLSNLQVLIQLVPHIAELSWLPVVLHFAVNFNLSDMLLLCSAIPFFLLLTTVQQSHDNAILASKLAWVEKKAVMHVFYQNCYEEILDEVTDNQLQQYLPAENGGTQSMDNWPQLFHVYESVVLVTTSLVQHPLHTLSVHGSVKPHTVIFILGQGIFSIDIVGVKFMSVFLFSPLPASFWVPFWLQPSA